MLVVIQQQLGLSYKVCLQIVQFGQKMKAKLRSPDSKYQQSLLTKSDVLGEDEQVPHSGTYITTMR